MNGWICSFMDNNLKLIRKRIRAGSDWVAICAELGLCGEPVQRRHGKQPRQVPKNKGRMMIRSDFDFCQECEGIM
jgi:hypothetical protein